MLPVIVVAAGAVVAAHACEKERQRIVERDRAEREQALKEMKAQRRRMKKRKKRRRKKLRRRIEALRELAETENDPSPLE